VAAPLKMKYRLGIKQCLATLAKYIAGDNSAAKREKYLPRVTAGSIAHVTQRVAIASAVKRIA